MQPSKALNTRYQPKTLYLVAIILFCLSTIVGISVEYNLPWVDQAIALIPSPKYIHWYSHEQALVECAKTSRPILYFLLNKKDPSALMLDSQCFGDQRVAELINTEFIPVVYWYDYRKKGWENDPEYKYYTSELNFQFNNSCYIAVVPPALRGAKCMDVTSSANPLELGIDDIKQLQGDCEYNPGTNYNPGFYGINSYRSHGGIGMYNAAGAISWGYSNKQDFLDFLYSARMWHKLPPTVGRIKWLPLDHLDLANRGGRPKLIAFVQDVGVSSDTMRLNLFWKDKSVDYINKNFDPYLIEIRRRDPAFNKKYSQLRKDYDISELPALLVLNPQRKHDSAAPVQHGYSNVESIIDFLKSTLKPDQAPLIDATPRTIVLPRLLHHRAWRVDRE